MKKPKIDYDLRLDLLGLWKLQRRRIFQASREERRHWRSEDSGKKQLNPKLNDEIELAIKIVEALFLVNGKASEGRLGNQEEDEFSPEERSKQKKMKEGTYSLLRKGLI